MNIYKNQSSDLKGFYILISQVTFTVAAFYVSYYGTHVAWLLGQIMLGVVCFRWFVIHHDMIHNNLFKTSFFNNVFGHVSSIPTLLPYHNFKLHHHEHHYWTGWKDKDPSNPEQFLKEPPAWVITAVNICWRFWIPLLSITFVALSFWNIPRLFQRFKGTKDRIGIVFGTGFIVAVYTLLFTWFSAFMLYNWLLGFIIYLSISDIVLMSQHSHIHWHKAGKKDVEAFKYTDQSEFTRTIVYPKYFSKFLFYNFDKHGLHHQYPSIPVYQLGKLPPAPHMNVGWREWLKTAKSMSASSLIYSSPMKEKTVSKQA